MRVLYVNHTAEVSGAERSLLTLLAALPDSVEPLVATPSGQLAAAVHDLGIETAQIPGTAGSLKLHPLHTPRALGEMGAAAVALRRGARRFDADVVHANSIRAGLVLGLGHLASTATVAHIRDCLPPGPVSTATLRTIAATVTTVVANSEYTANSVRKAAPNARLDVVHNPVDLERWNPARIDRMVARARLDAGEGRLLLGVVAQLTPWKGQDTAIDALRIVREQEIDAHLLLIGSAKFVSRSTRYDNQSYVAGLRAQIAQAGLEERVSFLGEREDVPELVRALDVLLLPSWEEPFGRALIEAMALNVPVVATNVGGPSEIVREGREGFLVDPRDPQAWAQAIAWFAENPKWGWEMGRTGRRRVEEAFTVEHHVAAMLGVYTRAVARVGV